MATRERISAAIAVLAELFRVELSSAGARGYRLALNEIPDADLEHATARALKECKFMPAPSELLALGGHGAKTIEQAAAEAWEAVRGALDTHDYTASVDFGPLVNATVRSLGGWQYLCDQSLPDLVWRQKDFVRVYETLAAKPVDVSRGAPLIGFLKLAPVRVSIAGVLPPLQLAEPRSEEAHALVTALADDKAIDQPAEPATPGEPFPQRVRKAPTGITDADKAEALERIRAQWEARQAAAGGSP